jgi:hypothetical protein
MASGSEPQPGLKARGCTRRRSEVPTAFSASPLEIPLRATGLLCREYKARTRPRKSYKDETTLLAELRNHERQSAQELRQRNTKSETAAFDPAEMIRLLHEGAAERGKTGMKGWRSLRDAGGTVDGDLHKPRSRYRRAEADLAGCGTIFKLALRLARTPRCLLRLDEEFLEITHCRRVALCQFRRDPIPQCQ